MPCVNNFQGKSNHTFIPQVLHHIAVSILLISKKVRLIPQIMNSYYKNVKLIRENRKASFNGSKRNKIIVTV